MDISNPQLIIFYPNGAGDFFSDSLPDSFSNPQLDMLSLSGNIRSPIGDNMANWGYCLLVLYSKASKSILPELKQAEVICKLFLMKPIFTVKTIINSSFRGGNYLMS